MLRHGRARRPLALVHSFFKPALLPEWRYNHCQNLEHKAILKPMSGTLKLVSLVGGLVCLSRCAVSHPPEFTAMQPLPTSQLSATIAEAELPIISSVPVSITHQRYDWANSTVQVVTIPPNQFKIGVAVDDGLAPLSELAQTHDAIAAINAGFFDPQNGLTTSFVIVSDETIADPQQNERLMLNPDLVAYLPAILNRSEFRAYDCAGTSRYAITRHQALPPTDCTIRLAVGAGPQLLPNLTGEEEAFWADNEAGVRIRDVIGSQTPNARSAIGIKPDGSIVFAIAQQVPGSTSPSGLTLPEMAQLLAELGVTAALNLDGGSSTSLYVNGNTYFGRLDTTGLPIKRPIKSALYVLQDF